MGLARRTTLADYRSGGTEADGTADEEGGGGPGEEQKP